MNRITDIIYLDNNATTAIKPAVAEAMHAVMMLTPLNASSVHTNGREAKRIIESARKKVAKLIGANEDSLVIFTSCGTEANNLAIKGVKGYKTIVSATEHFSVLKASPDAHICPVDKNGIVDLKVLERILKTLSGKALVSVMLANNETGVINPIKEIAELVHKFGGIIHTDAIQAVGKIEINIDELGVDMLSVSAHKFGGPVGVGALIARKKIALSAIQNGGEQEFGLRAGTENIIGIAGFGVAAELAIENLASTERLRDMRNYMEKEIVALAPEAKIYGESVNRLANTSCISMPGIKAETQLIEFDLAGIAVSSGSACSSGKVKSSHVLEAMGVTKEQAETAIRISFGVDTTEDEVNSFIEAWKKLYQRAGKQIKAA